MDKLPYIQDGDMIKVRLPGARRDGLRGPVKLKRSLRRGTALVMVPSIWRRNQRNARMISISLVNIVSVFHDGVEKVFETQEVQV